MPEISASFCYLSLNDLSLAVHLGCTASERTHTQEVRVNVEIAFQEPPRGMLTDNLADTVCYARLSSEIKNACQKEFQTIEHLGFEILKAVKSVTSEKLSIEVHKVRPPVDGLLGGSRFRCGDLAK